MRISVNQKNGSPDVLQLKEVEKPNPRDNEVLIRIYAAAVTASDSAPRKGDPFIVRFATDLIRPEKPIRGDDHEKVSDNNVSSGFPLCMCCS